MKEIVGLDMHYLPYACIYLHWNVLIRKITGRLKNTFYRMFTVYQEITLHFMY